MNGPKQGEKSAETVKVLPCIYMNPLDTPILLVPNADELKVIKELKKLGIKVIDGRDE